MTPIPQGATRTDAAGILADRLLIASRSPAPANLQAMTTRYPEFTGLVMVGPRALKDCHGLELSGCCRVVAFDPARYETEWASAEHPFDFGTEAADGLLGSSPTLATYVESLEPRVLFSPTGQIAADDVGALTAAIDHCNDVDSGRLVCTLPVAVDWLTDDRLLATLIQQIRRSAHLVALVVVAQLDPFEEAPVYQGLKTLMTRVGSRVMLHRSDVAGVHAIAYGGRAAVFGATAALRHTTPIGARPWRRRRGSRPKVHIFVPRIDSFVELGTLERWFKDCPPMCEIPGCGGHSLTAFDSKDDPRLVAHNIAGVLEVAACVLRVSPRDRQHWLSDQIEAIAIEFDRLRARTKVREIEPYGMLRHLIKDRRS